MEKKMRSNLRSVQLTLAAITFTAAALGFEAHAAGAAPGSDGAPVIINDHLVGDFKGSIAPRFYHRFTNDAPGPADVIRFTINAGSRRTSETVTETGLFSPGVGIDRADNLPASFSQTSHNMPSCVVTYVHFTDGTSWTAPTSQ
jgi:hypothetical protein